MRLMKFICFSVNLLWFVTAPVQAQHTSIEAKIDLADILIGEQTVIHLTITTDKDKNVYWPIPSDFLMPGVEVLSLSKPDTSITDNKLVIKQDVLITSFDSSLYLLPPFKVIDQVDTFYSDQVALKVSTVPVNLDEPENFYDIKDVWKAPFVLADYYPLIFGVLLFLFLICLIGYIIQRISKKPTNIFAAPVFPKLPPYEEAIQMLDNIKQQKLWQQGRAKEYHTQITDTLRNYISRRYGIQAMEMTSGEILDMMQRESESQSILDSLKQVLYLADYVKFAKFEPLPDENDLSMMNAYLFVNQTRKVNNTNPQFSNESVSAGNQENVTNGSNLKTE